MTAMRPRDAARPLSEHLPPTPQRRLDLTPPKASKARITVAKVMFRRAVSDLPIKVHLPNGTVLGKGGPGDPEMVIHAPEPFYARIGTDAKIGFGEAYMAGEWEPADGTDLGKLLTPFAANVDTLVPGPLQRLRRLAEARRPHTEDPSTDHSEENVRRHYDLSNDLFVAFLDETMSYSSAMFAPGDDLPTAQRRKVDANLDMAGVGPGTRLLEIGSGWGQLAMQAAQRGAQVTTITLSSEQHRLATQRIADGGLADRVDVVLADYREITGSYDAIVSVEMIEAVGQPYWDDYFAAIHRCLAPGGKVAVQAITMPHHRMWAMRNAYTWIHKYIFPGGLIPSVRAVEEACADNGLTVTDRTDFGQDYATTLRMWRSQFLDAWPTLEGPRFDATFRRMWEFYLAYCEAGFAGGYLGVSLFGIRCRET